MVNRKTKHTRNKEVEKTPNQKNTSGGLDETTEAEVVGKQLVFHTPLKFSSNGLQKTPMSIHKDFSAQNGSFTLKRTRNDLSQKEAPELKKIKVLEEEREIQEKNYSFQNFLNDTKELYKDLSEKMNITVSVAQALMDLGFVTDLDMKRLTEDLISSVVESMSLEDKYKSVYYLKNASERKRLTLQEFLSKNMDRNNDLTQLSQDEEDLVMNLEKKNIRLFIAYITSQERKIKEYDENVKLAWQEYQNDIQIQERNESSIKESEIPKFNGRPSMLNKFLTNFEEFCLRKSISKRWVRTFKKALQPTECQLFSDFILKLQEEKNVNIENYTFSDVYQNIKDILKTPNYLNDLIKRINQGYDNEMSLHSFFLIKENLVQEHDEESNNSFDQRELTKKLFVFMPDEIQNFLRTIRASQLPGNTEDFENIEIMKNMVMAYGKDFYVQKKFYFNDSKTGRRPTHKFEKGKRINAFQEKKDKKNDNKEIKCYRCNHVGHRRPDCHSLFADDGKYLGYKDIKDHNSMKRMKENLAKMEQKKLCKKVGNTYVKIKKESFQERINVTQLFSDLKKEVEEIKKLSKNSSTSESGNDSPIRQNH